MNALESPLLWMVVAAAVAVAAFLAFRRTGSSAGRGFKDIVRNPEYWQGVEAAFEAAERSVEEAQRWDDATVEQAVRAFVFDARSSREAWMEARILRELGERTHPTVLAILNDRSRYERLVTPTGKTFVPEAPFNRACDLLGDLPPVAAVDAVAPFLDDPADGIREDAACVLGRIGAPEAVPLLQKALGDAVESVRSYALMGLESALNRERVSKEAAGRLLK